jgi:nucleoside-diphosphate-sugar epimerase
MRVLIVGGTSFVELYILKKLVEEGHEVAIFHRGSANDSWLQSVKHIRGEVKHIMDYRSHFEQFAPDVVVDMASGTAESAALIFQAVRELTSRVIVTSSHDVYRAFAIVKGQVQGELEPIPLTEDSKLRPNRFPNRNKLKPDDDFDNLYDKLLVEEVWQSQQEIQVTILRLPAIYGPGDPQHRLFSYLKLKPMLDHRPHILLDDGFANWRWSHSYVENVAHAMALAIAAPVGKHTIYNIANPNSPTMLEHIQNIAATLDWNGQIIVLPKSELPSFAAFPYNTNQSIVASSERFEQEFGAYDIIPYDETLKRTVKWEVACIADTTLPDYHAQLRIYEQEDQLLIKLK